MSSSLNIAVAQPESILHDVDFNALRHAELIRQAQAQVVVFPELSVTGYAMDVQPLDPSDVRLAPIVEACRDSGSVALVGAPTAGGQDEVHISTLHVDGGGVRRAYDKMWLGGDEPDSFSPGANPRVIMVHGWRLGLAICKDTGNAKHALATAALGIDVYVASVCETEHDRSIQPLRAARVIEDYGVWVAVASFAGATGGGFVDTAGRSAIWRPDGTAAVELGRPPGRVGQAVLRRSVAAHASA